MQLDACLVLHAHVNVVIGAAAVCDFRPRSIEETKHKRGNPIWLLELFPTEDILETLGQRKDDKVHVGFALETDDLIANATDKLRRKKLDWIVGNSPHAIGAVSSDYVLLGSDGSRHRLGTLSKDDLAARLLDSIEKSL